MAKKDEEAAPAVEQEAAPAVEQEAAPAVEHESTAVTEALVREVIAGCRDIANDPRTPEDTRIQLCAWADRFELAL
jgi:hypothetical protein